MDSIGAFIAEATTDTGNTVDNRVAATELFAAYTRWCQQNNEDPKSQTAFGRRLKEDMGSKPTAAGRCATTSACGSTRHSGRRQRQLPRPALERRCRCN